MYLINVNHKVLRSLYLFGGISLVAITSIYFLNYLVENWSLFREQIVESQPIPTLIALSFCYMISYLVTSVAWYILLASFGEKPKALHTLNIILRSQFGKYLPGNFGHHVGRVLLAHKSGLAKGPIAMTMIIEVITVILAASGTAFIAITVGQISILPTLFAVPSSGNILIFGILVISVVVYLYLSRPLSSISLHSLWNVGEVRIPKILAFIGSYLLYTTNFLLLGMILYVLMLSFSNGTSADFWFLTGVFSLAWIAGFITPGAPAGLGVREAILVSTIDPIYGAEIALSLTVSLRIICTLGDGIGFIVGLALNRKLEK